jgi:hypothetical protein
MVLSKLNSTYKEVESVCMPRKKEEPEILVSTSTVYHTPTSNSIHISLSFVYYDRGKKSF